MKMIDIALRDLKSSFRNLFAVGMMLVIPLLIVGLIYFAFGGLSGGSSSSLADFRVQVVNKDQPPAGVPALGDLLVTFLQDDRMPDWLIVNETADEQQARQAVDSQQAGAAVLLPEDFSAQLMNPNGQANIILLQDPTLTVGPAILNSLIQQFVAGVSGTRIALQVAADYAQSQGQPFDAAAQQSFIQQYSDWYTGMEQNIRHGEQPALVFLSPNQKQETMLAQIVKKITVAMLIFFVYFGAASTAQSILKEEEEGTLARLFSTPTPRYTVLAGKFLSVLAVVIVQSIILLVASSLIFKIDWGQPFTIALLVFGLCLSAAGFAIFLLSIIRNLRQSGPMIGAVLSAMGMLGGLFTVAVPSMPSAFSVIQRFTPVGWSLAGWQAAMEGAPLSEILLSVGVVVGMGILFFVIGNMNFRRRFA